MQYDKAFYARLAESARSSALHIVPVVMRCLAPRSVIDIGCGTGSWLSIFAEYGVTDFCGVDGDYFSIDQLLIPAERFVTFDLSRPYTSGRRYDLVVSLE